MVRGYLSLLHSVGEKPLEYWGKQQSRSGRIRKIWDSDLLENVIEIQDSEQQKGSDTSIRCPPDSFRFLNIELPILVIVIKNLNLQCLIQMQVIDTDNCNRRFQFSNADFAKHTGAICRAKFQFENGWNKLEFDLADLMENAYKSRYKATQRLEIRGNCRLRRIYFIDQRYDNYEICAELYHGFLDHYMLKWGIHAVDETTQTGPNRFGDKAKETRNFVTSKDSSERSNQELLKILQTKIAEMINEFFERRDEKSSSAVEFKQRARMKAYVLPRLSTVDERIIDPNFHLRDNFKKIDVLRAFTKECVQKRTEDARDTEDKWRDRYFPLEEKSFDVDLPKLTDLSYSRRPILGRKPRSAFFLSEVKGSDKKEAFRDNENAQGADNAQ